MTIPNTRSLDPGSFGFPIELALFIPFYQHIGDIPGCITVRCRANILRRGWQALLEGKPRCRRLKQFAKHCGESWAELMSDERILEKGKLWTDTLTIPWIRWVQVKVWSKLGGGFKYFQFSPLPGEMIQFWLYIFFKWVGEPTTN